MTYKRLIYVLIVFLAFSCKPKEEVVKQGYFQPVFDHTEKSYVNSPNPPTDGRLDTLVKIKSNFRPEIISIKDTARILDTLMLTFDTLAIDLELINEKPPIYDTTLVVSKIETNNYKLFHIVDSFRVEKIDTFKITFTQQLNEQPIDSLALSDSTSYKPDSIVTLSYDSLAFDYFYYTKSYRADFINDSLVFDSNLLTNKTLPVYESDKLNEMDSVWKKEADSLAFRIDSLMFDALKRIPYNVGDSIAIYEKEILSFKDSTLTIEMDSVFTEIIDSSRIVKQYNPNQLTAIQKDTFIWRETIYTDEEVTIWEFYPEEHDIFVEMVRVRGGRFFIGSSEFDEDERFPYRLELSSFLMLKHEVDNKLFCDYLNDINCDSTGYYDRIQVIKLDPYTTKLKWVDSLKMFCPIKHYEKHPVVDVTWIGAQMFCKYFKVKLPTEAQWEYAARGGRYAKRYFKDWKKDEYIYEYRFAGSNIMNRVGWFVDNSYGTTHKVGQLQPNELGLFDMCGNVWEWCYDNYSKQFYRRNPDSKNPVCINGNKLRVNRGGSWSSDAMYCRVTNRNYYHQFNANEYLGFRFVK